MHFKQTPIGPHVDLSILRLLSTCGTERMGIIVYMWMRLPAQHAWHIRLERNP